MKNILRLAALALLGVSVVPFSLAECTTNRNPGIMITKPDSQYTDHGDGTVTDNKTRLIWQKCSLGQSYNAGACDGTATPMNWQEALTAANNNTQFGYDDWMLPNVKQLGSLKDVACHNPSINETLFPSTVADYYWSSSPHVYYDNNAWGVNFGSGADGASHKDTTSTVRLVRASQQLTLYAL